MQRHPFIAHFLPSAAINPPSTPDAWWDASWPSEGCRGLTLSAGFEQMRRMFQAGLGQLRPAQHAGDLLRSFGVVHATNLGLRAPAFLCLFNQKVLIAESCNLRQMRDAQHLLSLRQSLQLL